MIYALGEPSIREWREPPVRRWERVYRSWDGISEFAVWRYIARRAYFETAVALKLEANLGEAFVVEFLLERGRAFVSRFKTAGPSRRIPG